jgi:hypothetical protein
MNRETVYATWKGQDHPWVSWVKPSLFAAVSDDPMDAADERHAYRAEVPPWAKLDTSWLVERAAVIVDLPATAALSLGLALGQRGVRPVLAISACSAEGEVISMRGAIDLLELGARFASAFPTGEGLLPAFLLDSRRAGEGLEPSVGSFDNRWAVFKGDLPSVGHLRRSGVEKVLFVHQGGARAHSDIVAILRGYQAGGLEILLHDVDEPMVTKAVVVGRRSWISEVRDRLRLRSAYRRRWDGSFGHRVPEPSHG